MEKLTMPQIIGKMAADQSVMEIELKATIQVYGDNIPADSLKTILENLQKRIKNNEELWQNRA